MPKPYTRLKAAAVEHPAQPGLRIVERGGRRQLVRHLREPIDGHYEIPVAEVGGAEWQRMVADAERHGTGGWI